MRLPTQAVKAIIIKDGKILLLQRNKPTFISWDLPGGLVENGEIPKQALIREVKEETGLSIDIVKKSKSWKFLRAEDQQWISVQNYLCSVKENSSGTVILSHEHLSYQWVSLSEIRTYLVKDLSFYEALR